MFSSTSSPAFSLGQNSPPHTLPPRPRLFLSLLPLYLSIFLRSVQHVFLYPLSFACAGFCSWYWCAAAAAAAAAGVAVALRAACALTRGTRVRAIVSTLRRAASILIPRFSEVKRFINFSYFFSNIYRYIYLKINISSSIVIEKFVEKRMNSSVLDWGVICRRQPEVSIDRRIIIIFWLEIPIDFGNCVYVLSIDGSVVTDREPSRRGVQAATTREPSETFDDSGAGERATQSFTSVSPTGEQ